MAKFAGISPLAVLDWPYPVYLDYVEYMELHAEIEDRMNKRAHEYSH